MSTLKRAFLYTLRKKTKTIILFLVLVTISTFILTGLSIYKAADDSALSLRQSVGGSIRLELDESNRKNWQYQQASIRDRFRVFQLFYPQGISVGGGETY